MSRSSALPLVGIAAIFKNEAPYIIEWLAHYRLQGIRHFFIADNGSTDQTTTILQRLAELGFIHYQHFVTLSGTPPQLPAYQHLLQQFGHMVDWMAFVDADEFITPTDGASPNEPVIAEVIARAEQDMPNLGGIAVNWAVYGSSGHRFYNPRPVAERFGHRAPQSHPVNRHFKSIVRPKAVKAFECPHHAELHPAWCYTHTNGQPLRYAPDIQLHTNKHSQSSQVVWQGLRINHYVIKSYDEFLQKKQQRGVAFPADDRNNQFYIGHDLNQQADTPHPSYLQALELETNTLCKAIHMQGQSLLLPISQDQAMLYWSVPAVGHVDAVEQSTPDVLVITGWALAWGQEALQQIHLHLSGQPEEPLLSVQLDLLLRPDVLTHYSQGVAGCGFRATFRVPKTDISSSLSLRGVSQSGFRTAEFAQRTL